MRTCVRTFLGLLLVMAVAAGCSETPTDSVHQDEQEAPALPGPETMQFDLSFFTPDPGAQAAGFETEGGGCSKLNWLNAAFRVGVVDLIVAAGMTPPTLAFAAAVTTRPSYLGDLTWLWIYTWVDAQHRELQVRLQGTLIDDGVAWEMRVSSDDTQPPFDETLWFRGVSPIGYGEGYWIVNDLLASPAKEVFRIEFATLSDVHRTLSFEDIDPDDPSFGDSLSYEVDGDFYTMEFYDASADETAEIEWDRVSRAGSLRVPDFNGGQRACWNEDPCDTECPSEEN